MHDLGRRLNRTLRAAADQPDWALVDGIEAGFGGHGYCARVPYFVSAEESCRNQGDLEGTSHPNKRGHDVVRDHIADALQRHVVNPYSKTLEPLLQNRIPRLLRDRTPSGCCCTGAFVGPLWSG